MQSSKGIRSKVRGPLAGLAVGAALTLGIALVPGAWGPAFGDTSEGGGGASGGVNISTSVAPGGTATASSSGQVLTIAAAGPVGTGGASVGGTAVYPGICAITVNSPIAVDVAASLASGPNAFNVMIQPAGPLGPGENVLAAVACIVTPPVSGLPPMAWYVTSGGTQVMIDPVDLAVTSNLDGSWTVRYAPVNVNDFANGGATLHFQ